MTQRIHLENSIPASEISEKQAYEAPVLKVLGDVDSTNNGTGTGADAGTGS